MLSLLPKPQFKLPFLPRKSFVYSFSWTDFGYKPPMNSRQISNSATTNLQALRTKLPRLVPNILPQICTHCVLRRVNICVSRFVNVFAARWALRRCICGIRVFSFFFLPFGLNIFNIESINEYLLRIIYLPNQSRASYSNEAIWTVMLALLVSTQCLFQRK